MDLIRSRKRLIGYLLALAALIALLLLSLRSVVKTGAFLTQEGDWQDLAGDYRIGVINYTVDINSQRLLDMANDTKGSTYRLAVPILGGVRMFDPTLTGTNAATLRTAEFNEGATLMQVRVVNRSDSMVEVTADFANLNTQVGGKIYILPLPATLDEADAKRLNYRSYVLSTLKVADGTDETAKLNEVNSAYSDYINNNPISLYLDILPGATSAAPPLGSNVVTEDGRSYYYKDVFLLVWSEYGTGEYNQEGADASTRQAQYKATFTVGQLD